MIEENICWTYLLDLLARMMKEEESLLSTADERTNTSVWSAFNFYLKQPRLVDCVICVIIIGAIVATIIVCA